MLKTHDKFHSANGKRLILIVDDEAINRELLNLLLSDEYETLFAENGEQAIEIVRDNYDTLSLILLDLLMPGMHGLDVIKVLKDDPDLKNIPVIVMTADQEAEVASLKLGAADFIPKPYPNREVILARIAHSIELSEDKDIIQSTERDHLTGLYNREYFYRYAQQYDQHHKDTDMDAIVVDVNHFRMINERYGKAYGDDVLRRIGEKVREMVRDSGGIVCRREADTFLVYCPHREDYDLILENASIGLSGENASGNRVRLRMGVYARADKSIEIERRFDRAKMASDTVRSNLLKGYALYDDKLHETEIYEEHLLEDFQIAIRNRQFTVFYQPKFDVRPEIPVLTSAEALVRWNHPEFGLISPGVFIPLFEDNGLIQQLDLYVWREAAAQVKDWKERFGISIPVSVNVSRVDMYDPNLIGIFTGLLDEFSLDPSELLLEITESAYTQDSSQIIATVNKLRELGFRIEMDDFGTGYSSLNMISSLPIDALKLDMRFIRNAFKEGRDTRLIEVIIDIADYLNVPVIAEGVETLEQMEALRAMGCDIVQGYYFSKPVPAEEYEVFIAERAKYDEEFVKSFSDVYIKDNISSNKSSVSSTIGHALTKGFDVIYYIDAITGQYVQFSSKGRYEDLQMEKGGRDFFADAQKNAQRFVYRDDRDRVSLSLMRDALLDQLVGGRAFTMTYRLVIKDNVPVYYNLMAVMVSKEDNTNIVIGLSNIDEQMRNERDFVFESTKQTSLTLSRIARALSADYFSIYMVNTENDEFIEYSSKNEFNELKEERSGYGFFDEVGLMINKSVFKDDLDLALSVWNKETILKMLESGKPLSMNYRINTEEGPIYINCKVMKLDGEADNCIIVGISNVDEQMKREREYSIARERAYRDSLTGVKSKLAFDDASEKLDEEISRGTAGSFAMAVCDVNNLKETNDTLGHQAGDELLKNASSIICNIFRHSPVYRIGGDEFAAVLKGSDYYNREKLMRDLQSINAANIHTGGTVIACGYGEFVQGQDASSQDVIKRADAEMYRNKKELKDN